MGQALEIALSPKQRRELQSLVARASESAGVVRRAHVVLWSADGVSGQEIAQRLSLTVEAVSRIRGQFVESGVAGCRRDRRRGEGIMPCLPRRSSA
ncbi:MAG: helix-turn-helix domain-containing protein [Gemmatimonadetes bacterium]|nr:helix-turn-helix domain-containing protein [Gemmatimonadota bacterium]